MKKGDFLIEILQEALPECKSQMTQHTIGHSVSQDKLTQKTNWEILLF